MAEYVDDALLEEVLHDARNAGMDAKSINNLVNQVIRGEINQRRRIATTQDTRANRANEVLEKAQRQNAYEDSLTERLKAIAGGPTPASAVSDMPFTYGRNPRTGTSAWNNFGWVANLPEDYASLADRPNQLALAQRYNNQVLSTPGRRFDESGRPMGFGPVIEGGAEPVAPVAGGGPRLEKGPDGKWRQPTVASVLEAGVEPDEAPARSTRDPFAPPPNVVQMHNAQVAQNQAKLKDMLDASIIMSKLKIPPSQQDFLLYQMFPEAVRRKLDEDMKRLAERERLEGPRKDAALGLRGEAVDNTERWRQEQIRLQRRREQAARTKELDTLKAAYEEAKISGALTPVELQTMAKKLARMQYQAVLDYEALMNEEAPQYAPPQPEDPAVKYRNVAPPTEEAPFDWQSEAAKQDAATTAANPDRQRLEELRKQTGGSVGEKYRRSTEIARLERKLGKAAHAPITPALPAPTNLAPTPAPTKDAARNKIEPPPKGEKPRVYNTGPRDKVIVETIR